MCSLHRQILYIRFFKCCLSTPKSQFTSLSFIKSQLSFLWLFQLSPWFKSFNLRRTLTTACVMWLTTARFSVTAKKVLWKKVFGNKALNFVTIKVLWEKVLEILYKNVPGKKPYFSRKRMEQRMFTTMLKRGNWYRSTPGYIQYADA